MVTPQFLNISNSAVLPLESIVPVGENTSDNVQIKTLDAFGRSVDSYYWNDYMYDAPCWVDGNFEAVEGVNFAPGQGLWVYGSSTTQGLQTAGGVGMEDVIVQLRSGGTATGNPFPVKVALQDIIPSGENTSDVVQIKTLDAFGRSVDSYYWNDYMYDAPCWVDGNFEAVEGVEFAPGQGLWVYGSVDKTEENIGQYLRFPAPEL